jgi:hypothetical protein
MRNWSLGGSLKRSLSAGGGMLLVLGGANCSSQPGGNREEALDGGASESLDAIRHEAAVRGLATRLRSSLQPEEILKASREGFVHVHEENEAEEALEARRAPVSLPPSALTSFLRDSTVRKLVGSGPGLRAHVAGTRLLAPAAATWIAERGAKITALTSLGVGLAAELLDADEASVPSLVDGYVVYPGVLHASPATHLLRRVVEEGVEDHLVFADKPAREAFTYRVTLDANIAGLRLVSGTNTLEFLTREGTPRLRINPPQGMDADGRIFPVALSVDGCKVDESPALPYGRTPVDPGARACDVHFQWAAKSYPANVDPAFFATGSMSKGRFDHSSAVIGTGRVLVFGSGFSGDATAEVYDFSTGTWTAAANVPFAASPGAGFHTQLVLPDGRPIALQASGTGVAAYDPTLGTWASLAAMPKSMGGFDGGDLAVILQNGNILTRTGSLFTASTSTWSSVAATPNNGPGFYVAYGGSKVLWASGTNASSFDSTTHAWTTLAAVPFACGYSGGALLTDGRILASAQYPSTGKCAIYNTTTNVWTSCANQNSFQIIEAGVV